MLLAKESVNQLFSDVCDQSRSSVLQSNQAIVQQSAGRLRSDQNDHDARSVMAASALVSRNIDRGLRLSENGCSTNATLSRIAGYACLLKKDCPAALKHFGRSVDLDPSQTDAWMLRGQIFEHQGELDEAIVCYRRASVFARNTKPWLVLSALQDKINRIADAVHTLRVGLMRFRQSHELNIALARLLQRRAITLKQYRKPRARVRLQQEALGCLRVANSAKPRKQTLVMQGELQSRLGLHSEALQSLRAAVDQDPNCARTLALLANANVDDGDSDLAREQFRRAIEIEPSCPRAHYGLARSGNNRGLSDTQARLTQIESALESRESDPAQRVYLHFAAGKILDDSGRYDDAWRHYASGNKIKVSRSHVRQQSKTAKRSSLEQLRIESEKLFTPEFVRSFQAVGSSSKTPIFIVGMPRSGTTLVEQILSCHSQIAGAGELKSIGRMPAFLKNQSSAQNSAQSRPKSYPQLISGIQGEALRRCSSDYLDELSTYQQDCRYVTDKMPTNFMHLGLIGILFPNARVVHCRRNPLDVFVSCFRQNLALPFCDLDQISEYHRNYQAMMDHWKRVLPLQFHTVDYESMVSDSEQQSRELIDYCDLDWESDCLRFHESDRAVHTPSKSQVRQPIYSSSINSWRRYEKHVKHLASVPHGVSGRQ